MHLHYWYVVELGQNHNTWMALVQYLTITFDHMWSLVNSRGGITGGGSRGERI